MKKLPNWFIIILVLALIISSKFIFFSKKEEKGSAAKDKKNMPVSVNYFVVKADTLRNKIYTIAKIGAFNQVELIPEVNGKITAIYFKEGELVNKGSVLLKLNDAELQAQLLKNKTQINLAEQKLTRLKKLLSISGVSQEEYDMQENEVMTLRADEAYLKAQLAKTSLVAPFDGVIGLKNISEGSYVNTSNAIASLVQMKPVFVEFSIPEKYSSLLSKGLEIYFSTSNSNLRKPASAKVYAIEPMVDQITKTIKARALYSGTETFYPGSFVKVELNFGLSNKALMVPNTCVIGTLKGQKVFVSKNGIAVEVPIEIGIRNEKMIQVISGLNAGDTVVSTGLLSVRKDSKLTLIKTAN
jgi:membrane fusion protein (multidrug efflux system)